MSITQTIRSLFTRGGTMQATVERTEAEPGVRLAEVEAGISAGDGDVVSLLEEREALKLQLQAAAIARQSRADVEYRAKIKARRDKYLAEVQAELANVWRVLPELRWHLLGLAMLEQRTDEIGDGRSWEDVSGLPFGLVSGLSREIAQALAGTRLGEEAFTPGEVSTPCITPKPTPTLRVRFQGDKAAPPGYVGVWPPEAYDR